MQCICFSKDTGKTTSPTGHWEVQTFAHTKDWLVSPLFWAAMWFVVRYEAPGWKVSLLLVHVLSKHGQVFGCSVLTDSISSTDLLKKTDRDHEALSSSCW